MPNNPRKDFVYSHKGTLQDKSAVVKKTLPLLPQNRFYLYNDSLCFLILAWVHLSLITPTIDHVLQIYCIVQSFQFFQPVNCVFLFIIYSYVKLRLEVVEEVVNDFIRKKRHCEMQTNLPTSNNMHPKSSATLISKEFLLCDFLRNLQL